MEATTLFIVAITTAKMIMPGMPASMGKIPGMRDMNAPTRTMTMDLTSPKKADAKSKAECSVPEGLKIGPKAILDIDLPGKTQEDGPQGIGERGPAKTPDFTMKMYWKSSKTVLPGQPKVIDSKSMTAEMKSAMAKDPAAQAAFKKALGADDGSHAYWPGRDAKKLAQDSACPGNYVLTTNYCGETAITLSNAQDFLAPIDLTSPGKDLDLAKFIKVEWKPVPNAAAYIVNAFGGKDNMMVMWTSASEPNSMIDVTSRAISKARLEKLTGNGTLLAPDQTTVYIPEGIFREVGSAMLNITAVGVDKIQIQEGIETNVIVRSNATCMLGGGMMGMGGDEEEQPSKDPEVKDQPKTSGDSGRSGDVVDKADETVSDAANSKDKVEDKKDQVDNVINKAKNLFKRRR